MALCSFSSTLAMDSSTLVDNAFISEFMPAADGKYVKVYLYGLALCSSPYSRDNELDNMANVLAMSEDDIIDAFTYWESMGLVQIVSTSPLGVQFLPVRLHSGRSKTHEKTKYADFNKQAQLILSGRMIRPNEYNEYYNLIESYHFEPEALLMIMNYCTKLKNTSISYPYILTVANSFEKEGIKTTAALEEKLLEIERSSENILSVMNALGLKREADPEERNMFLKWTKDYGFTLGTIIDVAKSLKKHGGMSKLDSLLTKYYEQKLFSQEEIATYNKAKETMFDIAKTITKTLGLYYQDLENVVETYISSWLKKGYDESSLIMIASYCFKQSIRTLEGMDTIIQKFFKLGLVSIEAINEYIDEIIATDNIIKNLLETLGISRNVSGYDRDLYNTWTKTWQLSDEIIFECAKASKDKTSPIIYLNKLLSNMHTKNISTIEKAKIEIDCFNNSFMGKKPSMAQNYESRDYSSTDLNALFDSLDDIEV